MKMNSNVLEIAMKVLVGTLLPVPLGALLHPLVKTSVFHFTAPENVGHFHDVSLSGKIMLGYIGIVIPSLISACLFLFLVNKYITKMYLKIVLCAYLGGFWGYFLLDRTGGRDEGPVFTIIGIVVAIIMGFLLSLSFRSGDNMKKPDAT